MNKEQELTVKVLAHLEEIFDEDCEYHVSKEELEENLTMFIHVIANNVPAMIYENITGDNLNTLEFNHLANKLVFQFANKK